jgi:CRP-like cAMP-binding protein
VPNLADELKKVPLFSALSDRQLTRLANGFRERDFNTGTAVVRQNQMSGVGFFVIIEGAASVSVDGTEVARLGPGDHFGELALISEQVRSATVTAVEPLHCLVIALWNFRQFAKKNPDVTWKLLEYLVVLLTEERRKRAQAALQTS